MEACSTGFFFVIPFSSIVPPLFPGVLLYEPPPPPPPPTDRTVVWRNLLYPPRFLVLAGSSLVLLDRTSQLSCVQDISNPVVCHDTFFNLVLTPPFLLTSPPCRFLPRPARTSRRPVLTRGSHAVSLLPFRFPPLFFAGYIFFQLSQDVPRF